MHTSRPHTIGVVGGGILGALTALAAAKAGFKVEWFGHEEVRTDRADLRNYALSPLTVNLLSRWGVWAELQSFACEVTRMEVSAGNTRVDLCSADAGSEFLSQMVLHSDLLCVLEKFCERNSAIHRVKTIPDWLQETASSIEIHADNQIYPVDLLIGADGARSWVRKQSRFLWGQKDYDQTAIVASFSSEIPHGGVASQWFTPQGILALLPLRDTNQLSMVWSTNPSSAQTMEFPADLGASITGLSQKRYGELTLISEVVHAPLKMIMLDRQISHRTLLLGDSAHTVHPLAGYGLNLGVQDILCLERLWTEAGDPGAEILLAKYQRERHSKTRRVQWALDSLQRIVMTRNPAIKLVRELGMKLVSEVGPLRQFLIREAISPQ